MSFVVLVAPFFLWRFTVLFFFTSRSFLAPYRVRLLESVSLVHRGSAFSSHLVLLCYKRRAQQKGQCGSWVRRKRAILTLRVAIEAGLCRSARTRRTARLEVKRKLRGA